MGSLKKILTNDRNDQRVLSIQSHVVHGYAGNKCSVFLLQVNIYLIFFYSKQKFL